MKNKELMIGDYVLATAWQDGDPEDPWCVGFFTGMLPKIGGDRFLVSDGEGNEFRANGFRRAKKISAERGKWLIENRQNIQRSGRALAEAYGDGFDCTIKKAKSDRFYYQTLYL